MIHTGAADAHVHEQPFGVRDAHADAAVRRAVADRGGVGRAVQADARRRDAHPARAERVARAGRHGLLARGPGRVRRIPPGVALLLDDLEARRPASGTATARRRRRASRSFSPRLRVERDAVQRAVDDERGRQRARRHGGLDDLRRQRDRPAIGLPQRRGDRPRSRPATSSCGPTTSGTTTRHALDQPEARVDRLDRAPAGRASGRRRAGRCR